MRGTFRSLLAGAAMAMLFTPANAETKLTVIVFPGVQNLPMFAAQAKGFFGKRDLAVDLKFTPNSDELRNGLAEGRYQIAHSAVDNAFAMKDKANGFTIRTNIMFPLSDSAYVCQVNLRPRPGSIHGQFKRLRAQTTYPGRSCILCEEQSVADIPASCTKRSGNPCPETQ